MLTVAVQRFVCDDNVVRDLVKIKCRFDTDPRDYKKRNTKTKGLVRLLWSMLYADDAAVVSKTPESLAVMMQSIVSSCAQFGLMVSEQKTETMHLRVRDENRSQMFIEAAGQQYVQTDKFKYLGGIVQDDADITFELRSRRQRAGFKLKRFCKEAFHPRTGISLKTKMSLLKSEVTEALLYGCETWTLNRNHFVLLRQFHHHSLLRCVGFQKKKGSDHVLAYHEVLARTKCESIETMILRRRLTWAGKLVRMDNSRLPKAMLFGELTDGKRRLGRPPKMWRQGLTEALRDFDIDHRTWTEHAVKPKLWHSMIDVGAKSFMRKWHMSKSAEADARHAAAAVAAADT